MDGCKNALLMNVKRFYELRGFLRLTAILIYEVMLGKFISQSNYKYNEFSENLYIFGKP